MKSSAFEVLVEQQLCRSMAETFFAERPNYHAGNDVDFEAVLNLIDEKGPRVCRKDTVRI